MHQGWYINEFYTTLARDARLDGLSVVNTVGVALPRAVGFIFCKLGEWLPGVKTGLKLDRIADVCSLVENKSHRPIPLNKPIVGRGLSYLETEIALDLQRKYEKAGFKIGIPPFMPEVVSQEPFKLVLGKNSGMATIEYFLDKLGIQTTDDQAEEIMNRVKYEGRVQKSLISEARFAGICREVLR